MQLPVESRWFPLRVESTNLLPVFFDEFYLPVNVLLRGARFAIAAILTPIGIFDWGFRDVPIVLKFRTAIGTELGHKVLC